MDPDRYNPHIVWGSLGVLLVVCAVWFFLFSSPRSFPAGTDQVFTIEKGATLDIIATDLHNNDIIRFPFLFRAAARVYGVHTRLVAGEYVFTQPLDVFAVLKRISRGQYDLLPVRITIPEGLNKFEVAALLEKHIVHFDSKTFVEIAPEGYLFPDTYFFARNASPRAVIDTMTANFNEKIATHDEDITASGRTLEEIVSLASIVELEARQTETRKIIAGILWKRLDIDMPLQVDVSFKYINGKTTAELTLEDLDVDSPYNSYRYTGLPPTPIANPGLDALTATILPTKTPYLFFLSDKNGDMHYAQTFEKHKSNKEKYLR